MGGGKARGGDHARGGRPGWLRTRAAAGAPRTRRPCDGLLPRSTRGGRRAARATTRGSGGSRSSMGRPPRQRHRGDLPRRRFGALRLGPSVAVLPGTGGPGTSDETTLNLPLAAGGGDAVYRAAFAEHVKPSSRNFAPDLILVSAGFDCPRRRPARRDGVVGSRVPGAVAALRRTRPTRGRPCSKAATTWQRCPHYVAAAQEGYSA